MSPAARRRLPAAALDIPRILTGALADLARAAAVALIERLAAHADPTVCAIANLTDDQEPTP